MKHGFDIMEALTIFQEAKIQTNVSIKVMCSVCSEINLGFCFLSSIPEVKPCIEQDTVKNGKNLCFMTTLCAHAAGVILNLIEQLCWVQLITRRKARYCIFYHLFSNLKCDCGGRCFGSDDNTK